MAITQASDAIDWWRGEGELKKKEKIVVLEPIFTYFNLAGRLYVELKSKQMEEVACGYWMPVFGGYPLSPYVRSFVPLWDWLARDFNQILRI